MTLPRKVEDMIQQASQDRFWGAVEISFADGKIVLVRKTQTMKIQEEESTPYERKQR